MVKASERTLPPNVQALFLPKLVEEASRTILIEAYAERRAAAQELFRRWMKCLASGQLFQLSESQLVQDFTTSLVGSLDYPTRGRSI